MAELVRYAIVAKEEGESGTKHLQGYIAFKKPVRMSRLKKEFLGDRAHCEKARGTDEDNSVYCKKGNQKKDEWEELKQSGPNYGIGADFVEHGTIETNQGKRTDLEKAIADIKDGATLSDVAQDHSEVFVKFGRGLRDLKLMLDEPYDHDSVRGLWIWGPPGTGKSHHARQINPNSTYLKPQNKWFDGYNGQDIILLDDLDTGMLGHYLKIWADKYACTGETKGGTINLRHKQFVVTSNYPISYFFPEDQEMCKAVERRFKQVHLTGLVEHLDMLT